MHKDDACAFIIFDDTGKPLAYKQIAQGLSPFLGTCDIRKFSRWWESRAVPASREMMRQVILQAGCQTREEYLEKNLGLSMTDTYWLCPVGLDLSYSQVSFSNFSAINNGKIPYHNATSYDPNASLGGQMEKYWDLSGPQPVLVKESYKYFGQQSVNERFATMVHQRQDAGIPYVHYHISRTPDRGVLCKCDTFTNETAEFISAYEIIESAHVRNETSLYDAYIDICGHNGIPKDAMQDFMDYQTLTDFIISNMDEHLMNFGVLRNPDTLQLTAPAPIFDSGNSMFYSDQRTHPYSRTQLLELPYTGFYKSEEKMLGRIHNKNIVKLDLLPEPSEVYAFYANEGIPEEKAGFIAENYRTKLAFAQEFQHGHRVSLYLEKKRERAV